MADSYLIDGYNLIHALGLIDHPIRAGTLEKARKRLLDFLAAAFPDAESRVAIVFDARQAPPHVSRQQRYRGLFIHFAPGKQSADDLIETMIEAQDQPKLLVVISNDQRLQQAAHRCGARAWTHTNFLDFLDKRAAAQKAKPTPAEEEKQSGPMTKEEKDHWLKEFEAMESEAEFKEFFDMDRFEDD